MSPGYGGGAEPSGGVTVRSVPTAEYDATINRMLDAFSLPADVRLWVTATLEDGRVAVTVHAGAGDVTGAVEVSPSAALDEALAAILAANRPMAEADLKMGLARTMAAAFAGRVG